MLCEGRGREQSLASNASLSFGYYTARMNMHPVTIRSIYWGYRLLHLTPVVAIALLPVGKWLAAVTAAVWPVWVLGVFLFEVEVLRKWIGPVMTAAERGLVRDAEAGDADAQYRLARLHTEASEGFSGAESDRDAAIRWCREAAQSGHAEAAFDLAENLVTCGFDEGHSGDAIPPHPDDPIPQYRKQRMINGSMHDRAEAARWYRIAADRGHARAQGRLGEMYRTGNAVPKNRIAAHMWLSLALAGMAAESDGTEWPAPKRAQSPQDTEREEVLADYHGFAAALAELERTMAPAQIRQAQARVSGWRRHL